MRAWPTPRERTRAWPLALSVLFCAEHADAVSVRLSPAELVARADAVVYARVRRVPAPRQHDGAVDVEATVRRVVAGDIAHCRGEVRIRQGSGVSDAVQLDPGSSVVAFLRRVEECTFLPVGGPQGVLSVEAGSVRWEHRSEPVSALFRRIEALAAAGRKPRGVTP